MADTRVFRMGHPGNMHIYGTRRSVSARISSYGAYKISKIEATNAEATEGWTDVTEEFLGPRT